MSHLSMIFCYCSLNQAYGVREHKPVPDISLYTCMGHVRLLYHPQPMVFPIVWAKMANVHFLINRKEKEMKDISPSLLTLRPGFSHMVIPHYIAVFSLGSLVFS